MPSPNHTRAVPSVEVTTDSGRNVLRVIYTGAVRAEDMKRQIAGVQNILPRLGPGFVLVTDLSGIESMELDCGSSIARIMDFCLAAGVRKVIRIIPDPHKDIGFNLLSIVHYRGKVPTITCKTRDDAETELARG